MRHHTNHHAPCEHHHGGNDINDNLDYRSERHNDDRTDHDIAGDDHINHLVTSREQHDRPCQHDLDQSCDVGRPHVDDIDSDDLFVAIYDITHTIYGHDIAGFRAAVRAVHNAAARVLGTDGAADKPDDHDDAMRAYILERARYDAGISDNATIFGPLRDAARAWLARHGGV